MHSIVTTFRGADIKVEVANFCAAMDTLIDQDGVIPEYSWIITLAVNIRSYIGNNKILKYLMTECF